MWKNLKIDTQTAFMRCIITANEVKCILHDLQDCWIAAMSPVEVELQVKLLNRRIKFDAETIFDTLKNGDPEQSSWAVTPVINEAGDANASGDALERTLVLKYRVRRFHLNFKWQFRKQTTPQLHSLALNETSTALQELLKIVSELRETVRRKEEEIEQYKREGAVLRRVTVSTQSYNFDQLDKRVASTNNFADMLQQVVEHKKPSELPERISTANAESMIANALKSPTKRVEYVKKTGPLKQSPRNIKRKTLQAEKMRLARVLNARRRHLEYESSQSQSLVDSQDFGAHTMLKEESNATSSSANAVADEQVNARALSNKKPSCAATKSKRKVSVEGDVKESNPQKRSINTLTDPAPLERYDETPQATTSLNSVNSSSVTNRSSTTETGDRKRRNVVLSIKLSNTRELGVYIDNILNELDEIDKQLKESA